MAVPGTKSIEKDARARNMAVLSADSKALPPAHPTASPRVGPGVQEMEIKASPFMAPLGTISYSYGWRAAGG